MPADNLPTGTAKILQSSDSCLQRNRPKMSRTQQLAWNHIRYRFTGEELLLEALLRRGFLAYRDNEGVWLGTGSHAADASVLNLISSVTAEMVSGHPDRYCRVRLENPAGDTEIDTAVAWSILALGEHRGMSGCGLPVPWRRDCCWQRYRQMRWGAKLPVCPAMRLDRERVDSALDTGVALLVKAFPLIRVATDLCCDGHGTESARIWFSFPWDVFWARSVFSVLAVDTRNSEWIWHEENPGLEIYPRHGFDDESVTLMLDDIQTCARRLLDNDLISRIGTARTATIKRFWNSSNSKWNRSPYPSGWSFSGEAWRQLHIAVRETQL